MFTEFSRIKKIARTIEDRLYNLGLTDAKCRIENPKVIDICLSNEEFAKFEEKRVEVECIFEMFEMFHLETVTNTPLNDKKHRNAPYIIRIGDNRLRATWLLTKMVESKLALKKTSDPIEIDILEKKIKSAEDAIKEEYGDIETCLNSQGKKR